MDSRTKTFTGICFLPFKIKPANTVLFGFSYAISISYPVTYVTGIAVRTIFGRRQHFKVCVWVRPQDRYHRWSGFKKKTIENRDLIRDSVVYLFTHEQHKVSPVLPLTFMFYRAAFSILFGPEILQQPEIFNSHIKVILLGHFIFYENISRNKNFKIWYKNFIFIMCF